MADQPKQTLPSFGLTNTPPDTKQAETQARLRAEAAKELASRELARRSLRHYIERMMPTYEFDWVHEVVIAALQEFWEQVERKESPRLAVFMPPRVGKSLLSSIFLPTWGLGRSPAKEFVIAAYAANLADEFSKKAREQLREPDYHLVFPDTKLHKDMAAVDAWKTTKMGGYVSVGVGGGLTGKGADCLVYDTLINTVAGLVPIGELVEKKLHHRVLSYNHRRGEYEWKYIQAHKASVVENNIYRLVTETGIDLIATADHRIWCKNTNSYVPLASIRPGDKLKGNGSIDNEWQTVAYVERLSTEKTTVYDIQVEGNHNFFANGILVHNCLILDDLYKDRADADSDAYRRMVEDWFKSTAYTRIQPGGGCLVLFTRWHDSDLGGFIDEHMQHENFKVLRFAALAEEDDEYRKAGESINPKRRSAEDYLRIKKTVGMREWQCLYQQDPVPADGVLFRADSLRYYDKDVEIDTPGSKKLPDMDDMTIYSAWDFSTGRGRDFTVGMTAGIDRDYNIYILDIKRGKWTSFDQAERILDNAAEHKTRYNGMEQGQLSAMIDPILAKRMAERKQYITITPLKPGASNKVVRSMPIQARLEQGKVFLPRNAPWLQDFLAELLKFPQGKNDDQVDAFSYIGLMINNVSPPVKKQAPPKKGWRDKLKKAIAPGSSYMSS